MVMGSAPAWSIRVFKSFQKAATPVSLACRQLIHPH